MITDEYLTVEWGRPRAGDIGDPVRHIELVPLEAPMTVPAAPTPAPEPVPA